MIVGAGFYSITISNISTLILNMNLESAILTNIINDFDHLTGHC